MKRISEEIEEDMKEGEQDLDIPTASHAPSNVTDDDEDVSKQKTKNIRSFKSFSILTTSNAYRSDSDDDVLENSST